MTGCRRSPVLGDARVNLALGGLLALAFVVRAGGLGQPIVENYVGRQVPTAMVARNLERGSGFLEPRLDVGPMPNLFLVEPPLYAAVAVAVRRVTGLPLEAAGRLTSAAGIVLGACGLFGLAARREGPGVALAAVAAFTAFPVTIRYGRAFQPDALMLGCLVAGLCCWDGFERRGRAARLAAGFVLIAAGLALKVIAAYVLAPLTLVILRDRRPWKLVLAASTLLPALLWYAHAAHAMAAGGGSRASADNGAIWLSVVVPRALVRGDTYRYIGRFLFVRAFSPVGVPLAAFGLVAGWRGDRLWNVWGASALAALAVVSAKLHHEYYWLAVAPVLALGVGKALAVLAGRGARGRVMAAAAGTSLVALSAVFAASTWRTPPEWESLREAARAVRARVPVGAWLVAPEALLFESDRRGCRLEFTTEAARRAAGEWGAPLGGSGPLALVEFYRRRGAAYFADVRPARTDPERLALHEAVRGRYNVLVDRPGVLIAALNEPQRGSRFMAPADPATPAEPAVTVPDFALWKAQGRKISVLTAYDHTTARLLDSAGVDCLLVGDTLGMVVQGHETTLRVTLDQMIYHTEMVARAARRALVVGDLPFGSYERSTDQALASAARFLKETRCQAVKLEGGTRMAATIAALVGAGIPVMAHVGLTPQSVRKLGGYKVQRGAEFLAAEARAVADAGAFAVVLECVPAGVAAAITSSLPAPTIGIGAGAGCDGQVLVTPDLLGLFEGFRPKFVRRYAELAETIRVAASGYVADVSSGRFPSEQESFR